MSGELETLDQLLGGQLPLQVIRKLYRDEAAFKRGVYGLLCCGDVRLLNLDQTEVPEWRRRELFTDGTVFQGFENFRLEITDQGAHRIT